MNNHLVIDTNFLMPDGYQKRFVFDAPGLRMEISAMPPNAISVFQEHNPRVSHAASDSKALDWIHLSIEQMRYECRPRRKRKPKP